MTLGQARRAFTKEIAYLILHAYELGLEVALDEGMERLTAKDPTSDHMKGSLHHLGLSQDVLLFKDGVYLTDTSQYEALGVYWEARGVQHNLPLAWGGRFDDGNHFSFAWNGKK